jgi:hypothetical protein
VSLCITIPSYDGRIPVETAVHMMHAVNTIQRAGVPVDVQWGNGSALIDLCRNRLVNRFLKESTADRMIFLDNDIIFQADDLIKLYGWLDTYQVVGAAYPVRKDPPKFFLKVKGNVFETNEDGLIEVEGFGAGFLGIRREVFERLDQVVDEFETEDGEVLKAYFDIRIVNRRYKGEDISFMKRWIEECEGRVFLDPYINLKHVGSKEFDYKLIDYLNDKLERVN